MPATTEQSQLPWKVAFRVQFKSDKLGLKFQPAPLPDTGNGIYTVSLMQMPQVKNTSDWGPAQHYNNSLRKDQQHLSLREGLYLTHINDDHLLNVPCNIVISRLKTIPRPVKLRFVDVDAGTVNMKQIHSQQLEPNMTSSPKANTNQETELRPASPSPEMAVATTQSNNKTEEMKTASFSTLKTPMYSNKPDENYKIVLLGATGVGKSSILSVCIDGNESYTERRAATLEPEFGSLSVPNPDISNPNKVISVRIWDTAGQERYRAITRSHYRRADGAILVYDVADPRSFESLDGWLQDLKEAAADTIKSIILVENKVDQLPPRDSTTNTRPRHFVNEHRVSEYCKAHGLLFARTSARMNANVYRWEGQKVGDVVRQLVLNVHATQLARGAATPNTDAISLDSKLTQSSTPIKADCAGCS